MWTCVLLSDESARGPVDVHGVTVLPGTGPTALADHLTDRAEAPTLVLAPAALAAQASTLATVAAGRWPSVPLTVRSSAHAPLALLSALVMARRTTDEAAVGVALVDRLLDLSWSGAHLTSVAHLTRPAPSLAQHVRSWWPGSSFLVRLGPDPAVLESGSELLGGSTAASVRPGPVELLVSSDDAPRAVVERVAAGTRARAVRVVALPGSWASVVGAGNPVQLAVVPEQPVRPLAGPPISCRQCGLALPGPACPFCKVLVRSGPQDAFLTSPGGPG